MRSLLVVCISLYMVDCILAATTVFPTKSLSNGDSYDNSQELYRFVNLKLDKDQVRIDSSWYNGYHAGMPYYYHLEQCKQLRGEYYTCEKLIADEDYKLVPVCSRIQIQDNTVKILIVSNVSLCYDPLGQVEFETSTASDFVTYFVTPGPNSVGIIVAGVMVPIVLFVIVVGVCIVGAEFYRRSN